MWYTKTVLWNFKTKSRINSIRSGKHRKCRFQFRSFLNKASATILQMLSCNKQFCDINLGRSIEALIFRKHWLPQIWLSVFSSHATLFSIMSHFPFFKPTVWSSKILSLHLYSNQSCLLMKHGTTGWNVCFPAHTKYWHLQILRTVLFSSNKRFRCSSKQKEYFLFFQNG